MADDQSAAVLRAEPLLEHLRALLDHASADHDVRLEALPRTGAVGGVMYRAGQVEALKAAIAATSRWASGLDPSEVTQCGQEAKEI